MTHRRYRDRATAAEKDRLAGLFGGPKWCDRCQCTRPQKGGREVVKGLRKEWHCAKHVEAGDGH